MPLFEIETDSHIIITWAADETAAGGVVHEAYPHDKVIRLTKRPRDTWVISKGALGLIDKRVDPCSHRPRLPVQGRRRQGPRHPPLHARNGHRPGHRPQSDRVEHGHGLVTLPVIVGVGRLTLPPGQTLPPVAVVRIEPRLRVARVVL